MSRNHAIKSGTAGVLLLLCSCTAKVENSGSSAEAVTSIRVEVPELMMAGAVKSSFGEGGTVTWDLNDEIGFYPDASCVKYGDALQSGFYVLEGGSSEAEFKANGWGLLIGNTYHSYYPYDENAAYDSSTKHYTVTLDYTGQRQTVSGSTAHLGSRDYLYSPSIEVKGRRSVEYTRLGCMAIFNVTVSDPGQDVKFTGMTLSSNLPVLVASAKIDPSESPARMMDKSMVNSLPMVLGTEDQGMAMASGNKLTIYTMMSPSEWNGKKVTLSLEGTDGKYYSGKVPVSSNQQSGFGYSYNVVVSPSAAPVSGTVDLSDPETANCYIVSANGSYKFKAVQGNSTESAAIFGDSATIGHIERSVSGACLLWETLNTDTAPDRGCLIDPESVEYADGYISFSTAGGAGEDFREGNAVIALKGDTTYQESDILWTWHIWFTDVPGNDSYGSKYLMDRNLGALCNEPGNPLSIGLLYQWGRKDPFPGASSFSANTAAKANPSVPGVTEIQASENYSAEHTRIIPTTFIHGNTERNGETEGLNFKGRWWGEALTGDLLHLLWSDSVKETRDPCPPGYSVPKNDVTLEYCAMDIGGTGFYVKGSDGPAGPWFWPITGMMGLNNDRRMSEVGHSTSYWYGSAEFRSNFGYVGAVLNFNKGNNQPTLNNTSGISYCISGNPVRCQKR